MDKLNEMHMSQMASPHSPSQLRHKGERRRWIQRFSALRRSSKINCGPSDMYQGRLKPLRTQAVASRRRYLRIRTGYRQRAAL
jgi:hypothetical protein